MSNFEIGELVRITAGTLKNRTYRIVDKTFVVSGYLCVIEREDGTRVPIGMNLLTKADNPKDEQD